MLIFNNLKPIDFKINGFKNLDLKSIDFKFLVWSFYTMKDLKFHCLDT